MITLTDPTLSRLKALLEVNITFMEEYEDEAEEADRQRRILAALPNITPEDAAYMSEGLLESDDPADGDAGLELDRLARNSL